MEKENECVVKLSKKVSGSDWEKELSKVFEKNKKKIKLDGFRNGKVPFEVYKRKGNMYSIIYEASENYIKMTYLNALAEKKIVPIIEPIITINAETIDELDFEIKFITRPKVEIKKYKDLKVKREEVSVSDDEINHEIEHILSHYSELVIKDGVVENGDVVIIDYVGTRDGIEFAGGSAENYSLEIGSNTFIPGFEEGLIGAKKDEIRDIEVTFPEDYHEESLKGCKANFKVTIHEIKTKEVRKLDKELFEDLNIPGVDSEKSLREHIKNELLEHKNIESKNKFVEDLLDEIGKNTEVNIPDELVNSEKDRLIDDLKENLKHQGATLDLYCKILNTTVENIKNEMEPMAFKNVLHRLILEKVIELEKIEISDSEIEEKINENVEKYGITREELLKEIGGEPTIKYHIEIEKIIDRLIELNETK